MSPPPSHLRCEHVENPIGLDEVHPRFSWRLESSTSLEQAAYQILVSSSTAKLAAEAGDMWDSGRVESAQCHAIPYAGQALNSRQTCFWKVRIWSKNHGVSPFSETGRFEMALLHKEDWAARWMGWPAGRAGQAAYFRCIVELDFVPSKGRLYISGLGLYEAFVNGHRTDGVLQPTVSDASQRVYYNTWDVTSALQSGENAVAVCVGSGWRGMPMLIAQLEIEGPDGQQQTLATVRSKLEPPWMAWMAALGPVGSNSLFDGETYDARREKSGWNLAHYTPAPDLPRTEQWIQACIIPEPGGVLRAQPIEPIQVVKTLEAQSINEPQPGVFVFDFGQNHAGWARLRTEGPRGTRITLRYAESVHEDGTVNQDNLRTAAAEDTYILKGGGLETWEPRFTYHGYRYVQVEGWPGRPSIDALMACVVRSALAERGEFSCSEPLLNRIHHMVRWTEESNLHGVPTDCPQRDERMGWLNDMVSRSEELIYNFETARFLAKFLDDVADTQDEHTGAIADTAPFHWGFLPADPINIASLVIATLLHQHYGDTRPLERNYSSMQRWVDFLSSQTSRGILRYSHFGDWAPPASEAISHSEGTGAISARTPGELTSTAFYHQALKLLARISRIIGRTDNAARYESMAADVGVAFHAEFWSEAISGYGSGNQACNAIALHFNLVPREVRGRVVAALLKEIEACDFHLSTGNLATKHLLEVLSREGHGDVALRIATQRTYPSWGFMLEKGATTLWERWEELHGTGMNSHNHPMLGSVGSWFYRHVAGLLFREDETARPGLIIRIPSLTGVTHAQAAVQTIYGQADVAWRRTDGTLHVKAHIPWNCPATLEVPGEIHELTPGDHSFTFPVSSQALQNA
jgi:alpha-L-rhamnosidase